MAKFLDKIDTLNSKIAGLLLEDDIDLTKLSLDEEKAPCSSGKPHLVSSVYPSKEIQDELMRYIYLFS